MQVDTLIHAGWVIPVEPDDRALPQHSVAVENGRIAAVLPTAQAREQIQAGHVVERPDHALIPGLVNAHTHAAMSLMRGIADDLPLQTWLEKHIWPVEGKLVSEEFVHDGTQLAMAEMLAGGTTCFNDMYFFPDVTARAASAAGIRATVGLIVIDFPSPWAADADAYFDKGLALHDELRHEPLVHTAFAPHAPYSVNDQSLQRIRTLADELEIPVHMHVHETRGEVEQAVSASGKRPLQRLDELGLISPTLLAVHMTETSEQERQRIADAGAHILHCPESNMKLASGMCPVADWLARDVNVALGTDGAASNNDLDMFGEMRSAALLAKAVSGDASALSAEQTLHMATLGGARALGLADQAGSLLPGKSADMAAVHLGNVYNQPVFNPVSQLVYTCHAGNVSDTWVAGHAVYADHQLTTLELPDLLARANTWADRIREQQ